MEFGPRALGARSILGDPRSPAMQKVMNLKIKFRESFRPFAPAVLEERAAEFFELAERQRSPYMLLVAPVRREQRVAAPAERPGEGLERVKERRSTIPAVTHLDYSARLQTVGEGAGRFRRLLAAFTARTGCPVVVNTSFNVRGEPIVCTAEEALRCFLATDMDVLVLDRFLLLKEENRAAGPAVRAEYLASFECD
jgi:carbamoyltransferase